MLNFFGNAVWNRYFLGLMKVYGKLLRWPFLEWPNQEEKNAFVCDSRGYWCQLVKFRRCQTRSYWPMWWRRTPNPFGANLTSFLVGVDVQVLKGECWKYFEILQNTSKRYNILCVLWALELYVDGAIAKLAFFCSLLNGNGCFLLCLILLLIGKLIITFFSGYISNVYFISSTLCKLTK